LKSNSTRSYYSQNQPGKLNEMRPDEFRKYAHELVDWMTGYMENVESFPVKPTVLPGEIFNKLPDKPPEKPESFESFFKDFEEIIMPGMTHWQSPNFFAYFPANTSPPSILAEMLTSTLAAQCMIWETSPAAAELEQKVMNWLRDLIGLPGDFEGVIQDTASTATLASILTAREKATGFRINNAGAYYEKRLRIYCSEQAHSSVDKAARIAGMGKANIVKIPVREDFSMNPVDLENAVIADIEKGYIPCCVIATLGTTGTTAIDPLLPVGKICSEHNIFLHVDAALAGTALILPEYQWMIEGKEFIDTIVFNPHKWMFTNFDCSAYFVKDASHLIRTFEILPEYLKTRTRGKVNDYRDWGVPLGRRFRALKLWCVIRMYGVEGLREKVRYHIGLASNLSRMISGEPDFEILAPTVLNTVCFRFVPYGADEDTINRMNEDLNHRLNDSGKIYLTHTKLNGRYTLRLVTAQTNVTHEHVENAWKLIRETARSLV
jgi:aromatic-L-amino-acid decarboxylase